MKNRMFSVLVLLIFINCADKTNKISWEKDQTERDFSYLSYVTTFGSELTNTKEEYFFVAPIDMCVNGNGDILSPDENRIKVYEEYGRGKAIFGGLGQGPGEYIILPYIFSSPDGFVVLTVPQGGLNQTYDVFSPNYMHLNKSRFITHNLLLQYFHDSGIEETQVDEVTGIYAINERELVYGISIEYEEEFKYHIVYESESELKPVVVMKDPHKMKFPGLVGDIRSRSGLGMILWCLTPNRKIFYLNPYEDIINTTGASYYSVHFLSIDSGRDTVIQKSFYPGKIDVKSLTSKPARNKLHKKMREFMAQRGYYPSTNYIRYFREYIYVFPYDDGNYSKKDIFNANTETYVNSIETDEWGIVGDCCVYITEEDSNGFMVESRYDIDPIIFQPDGKTYKIVKKVK